MSHAKLCHVYGPVFSKAYRQLDVDHVLLESDFTSIRNDLGGNSGNLMFGEGLACVLQHTRYDKITFNPVRDEAFKQVDQINEQYDALIFHAAILLSASNSSDFYDYFYQIFKRLKVPCIALSVGAQAPLDYSKNFLSLENVKSSVNLLELLSQQYPIGCRGYFTAECLNELGIKNVNPIGCPSFYARGDVHVQKKAFKSKMKISVCLDSATSFMDYFHANIDSQPLLEKLSHHTSNMILQTIGWSELAFMHLLNRCANEDDLKETLYYLRVPEDFFNKHFALQPLVRKNSSFFARVLETFSGKNKQEPDGRIGVKAFFDIHEWDRFIKKQDFSFGGRLHGNLIALRAGVPAVIWAHDSRTRELSEFFKIPYKNLSQMTNDDVSSIEKLYEEADFSELNKTFPALKKNYFDHLRSVDLLPLAK